MKTVDSFLGNTKRVIFTIDGGSSARDVKRYSDYVQEDELLMPCGKYRVRTFFMYWLVVPSSLYFCNELVSQYFHPVLSVLSGSAFIVNVVVFAALLSR